MVVPRWSPLKLASAALAVLFLPLVAATPEVLDGTQATVFVDGDSDSFEFSMGIATSSVGSTWSITSPDGHVLTFTKTATANGGGPQRWSLGGTRLSGASGWFAEGGLDGAAADGTWTLSVRGVYYSYDSTSAVGGSPGPTLSVQGKAIHFGVNDYLDPNTGVQAWNWHMTTGTWNEPSTTPALDMYADLADEGPEEDPQYARFFVPVLEASVPGYHPSQTVPGQDVDTPPQTVESTCPFTACNAETPLVIPEQPVAQTCVPPVVPLLCVGPFTVPPQDFGNAPAVCDAAEAICLGPFNVPAQQVVETQPITVDVDFAGLDLGIGLNAGELTTIGPIVQVVPVPVIGDVPVTVCPQTCTVVELPEGGTAGSLTITVTVGAESRDVTIPLGSSL